MERALETTQEKFSCVVIGNLFVVLLLLGLWHALQLAAAMWP